MVGLAVQAAIQRLLHVVGTLLCKVSAGCAVEPLERAIGGFVILGSLKVSYVLGHGLEVLYLLEVPVQ